MKSTTNKRQMDKLYFMKVKKFYSREDTVKETKATDLEEILIIYQMLIWIYWVKQNSFHKMILPIFFLRVLVWL